MKNYILSIRRDTNTTNYNVQNSNDIRDILVDEYSWYTIFGVNSHFAVLSIDEKEIAVLNLPVHNDFSAEDYIEEDENETSKLYARLGREEWDNDYSDTIREFINQIP